MQKELIRGTIEETQQQLLKQEQEDGGGSGFHYMAVYPNLITLRKIYLDYVKRHIEENNEIVAILPYYETTDSVRYVLSEGQQDNNNNNNKIRFDIRKHEQANSLVIIDSLKAHFNSSTKNIMPFVDSLVGFVKQHDKNGLTIFADMGPFYHYSRINELVEHESLIQQSTKYNGINIKRYCVYHEKDFGRFREEDMQSLLKNHNKAMMIVAN